MTLLQFFLTFFAITGFALILATAFMDRVSSMDIGSYTLVSGFVIESVLFLLSVFGLISIPIIQWVSGSMVIWVIATYILFLLQPAKTGLPEEEQEEDFIEPEEVIDEIEISTTPTQTCQVKKTSGKYTKGGSNYKTWRTYLYVLFYCKPSTASMSQKAWVSGGAYYGIYFTTGKVIIEPRIDITCHKNSANKCIAKGSESGTISDDDSPVRAYIKNVVTNKAGTCEVVCKMGAALNASGGPSIAVSGGPVSITMSFPNASKETVAAMGTYSWECVKRASTGTPTA